LKNVMLGRVAAIVFLTIRDDLTGLAFQPQEPGFAIARSRCAESIIKLAPLVRARDFRAPPGAIALLFVCQRFTLDDDLIDNFCERAFGGGGKQPADARARSPVRAAERSPVRLLCNPSTTGI
jgi:hypothetical protein